VCLGEVGSRGRPIEIDIEQFGSLRAGPGNVGAGPDNVGAVILDLHRKPSAPPRMVNLADDESMRKPRRSPRRL
jgi:hypothetical protein